MYCFSHVSSHAYIRNEHKGGCVLIFRVLLSAAQRKNGPDVRVVRKPVYARIREAVSCFLLTTWRLVTQRDIHDVWLCTADTAVLHTTV